MAEPSLTAVFGAGATQDATTFTILKADLVSVGLTVTANNKAESLLAAILKKAAQTLTPENRDLDIDQSVAVDLTATPSFTTRTSGNTTATYIRDSITVELDKPYGTTEIDPDDY